jgi:hypothetical protein
MISGGWERASARHIFVHLVHKPPADGSAGSYFGSRRFLYTVIRLVVVVLLIAGAKPIFTR